MNVRLFLWLLLAALLLAVVPVSAQEPIIDAIDNDQPFIRYPITVAVDGATVVADIQAVSGDLDTRLFLLDSDENIVDENDDRSKNDTNSLITFQQAPAGDYTLIATRYKVAEGDSAGEFELRIEVQEDPGAPDAPHVTPEDLVAVGFPTVEPRAEKDWTVLVYYGGDNNLEPGLLNDLNEFEIGGGSTDSVNVIAMVDRNPSFTDSNGDWATARIFEISADVSADHPLSFPTQEVATIDSSAMGDLDELDTSSAETFAQFLVWAVRAYPARHYAVAFGSHGAGWQGLIQDDTSESGLLSVPELAQAFALGTAAVGVEQFDLLINDACLMSSVEYYAGVAPYFHYSLASAEVVVDPALDMARLLELLNSDPSPTLEEIGTELVDIYITRDILRQESADAAFLTHAVTNLDNFDAVARAVEDFAALINDSPAVRSAMLGEARANAYVYTIFLGDNKRIDLGSLMRRVIALSNDQAVIDAADAVLTALDAARAHGNAGDYAGQFTSYYNIYFPASSDGFKSEYFEQSPLKEWGRMLRNYYNAVQPQVWTGAGLELGFHLPVEPKIRITSIYPPGEISIHSQVEMNLEIVGRRLAYGEFTVDQPLPDGSARRLSRERLLVDVGDERLNLLYPGVETTTFFWDVTLPVVSDGSSSQNELIVFTEDVAFLDGRYREPGSDVWNDVGVVFNLEGQVQRVINRSDTSGALAAITIPIGSEFQAYNAIVTPDNDVISDPGNLYIWPQGGLTWTWQPAPNGDYDIGLLVTPYGGNIGFTSTAVTVNNTGADPAYRGNLWTTFGFNFLRPADWSRAIWFPDELVVRSSSPDGTQHLVTYLAIDAGTDLNAIVAAAAELNGLKLVGAGVPTHVAGQGALEIAYTRETENGMVQGRGLAVYKGDYPGTDLSYVFAVEGPVGADLDANLVLLRNSIELIDLVLLRETDTRSWELVEDLVNNLSRYPVRLDWLPTIEDGDWLRYAPYSSADSPTFAAVTRFETTESSAETVLDDLVTRVVMPGAEIFTVTGRRTYYGQGYIWSTNDYPLVEGGNHVWQAALYTATRHGEPVIGRMYAMIEGGYAYAMWAETPDNELAAAAFTDVFEPMLDGFLIGTPVEN